MENNIKNSEDYLKTVLKKNTGFSAPEDYFSDTEDKLLSFIFEEKLVKDTGFKVSETYFNNLENTILSKVKTPTKVKVISLKDKILQFTPLIAAASILLFLSINFYNNKSKEIVNFDSLANAEIESWILDNTTELTTEDFTAILNTEIINEDDFFAFTELQNDAIEDYIINTENASFINENY